MIIDEIGTGFVLPAVGGGQEIVYFAGDVEKRPYLVGQEAFEHCLIRQVDPSFVDHAFETFGLTDRLREHRPDHDFGVAHRVAATISYWFRGVKA